MTPAEQIHEKVLQLKQMIDAAHPGIDNWLRDIHTNIHKDESLAQVLSPEEMGIVVRGLEIKAKMKIVDDAVSKKVTKAKLGQLGLDDI
jgi:predicted deacylase